MNSETVTFKVNSIIYDALISEVNRRGTSKNALMSEILTNYVNENLQSDTCSFSELSEMLHTTSDKLIKYMAIIDQASKGGSYVARYAIKLFEESKRVGVIKGIALVSDFLETLFLTDKINTDQVVFFSKADINILAGNSRLVFTMRKIYDIIEDPDNEIKLKNRRYKSAVDGNWCDNICIGVTYSQILKFKIQ